MPEFNVVTAIPMGIVTAIIWTVIYIRKLLRAAKFAHLTTWNRSTVWGGAFVALVPALAAGFAASVPLSNLTTYPGVWNHLSMALTVFFCMAVIGTIISATAANIIAVALARYKAAPKDKATVA